MMIIRESLWMNMQNVEHNRLRNIILCTGDLDVVSCAFIFTVVQLTLYVQLQLVLQTDSQTKQLGSPEFPVIKKRVTNEAIFTKDVSLYCGSQHTHLIQKHT